jgi:hypothetical protein
VDEEDADEVEDHNGESARSWNRISLKLVSHIVFFQKLSALNITILCYPVSPFIIIKLCQATDAMTDKVALFSRGSLTGTLIKKITLFRAKRAFQRLTWKKYPPHLR